MKTKARGSAPFDLNAQLGSIATPNPAAPKPPLPTGRFKSRFFFTLDEDLIQQNKKAFAPKVLEHVDADAVRRLKVYKPKAGPVISERIDEIREFFLMEIAPLMLACSAGTKQAQEVVEKMIDAKVDTTLFSNFEAMVTRAARLKLNQFVLSLFSLPESFLDELNPRPDGDKKLTSILDDLIRQLDNQSKSINTLTNLTKATNEKLLRRPEN